MTQQVPIDRASVSATEAGDGTLEAAPGVAYRRLIFVNVVYVGQPGQKDWVLVDTGVPGMAQSIAGHAADRFGTDVPPRAIVLTHGHFDHVGALETLAERWDVPVYAHTLERPYLDGSASYPKADPSVGGGMMALLSPLYPRSPVNVGSRLRDLPADGSVPEMPGWRWIHTPGHSVGHVSLWRDADRTLIAGDAFVTVAGEGAYATAIQEPEIHGTGHGRALHGQAMRDALHTLARDFSTLAVPRDGRYVGDPQRAQDGSAYKPA